MLYQWYELNLAAVRPARAAAGSYRLFFESPLNPMAHTAVGRGAAAACEVFERSTRQYDKPRFGLTFTQIDGRQVAVNEAIEWQRPFCRLIHFQRDIAPERASQDPRILLVAPMSGHHATLLRGTVEALLPDHDVFITDWQDASQVPQCAGSFDLDDYITYMGDLFRHFGGDVHVVAVCQPAVPVLAAVALMEAANDPHVPASMILMGGPVDTRISRTAVNELAEKRGTRWFANNVIGRVPWSSPGYGRHVYPGFLQLSGFMSMNLDRHMKAQKDMFFHLVRGDGDSAEKHRTFYDEYLAVMDLSREFFLQTIDQVFVQHQLPRGRMMHRGRRIDLSAIRRVALMTVEGEKDDITGRGQCAAALDLCERIPAARKTHFECPGVGHYGIFNGRRFRQQTAPRIAQFVRKADARAEALHELPAIQVGASQGQGLTLNGAPRDGKGDCQDAATDLSAGAFSFARRTHYVPGSRAICPANDVAPDRLAERVKAEGLAALGTAPLRPPARSLGFAHALAMQSATLRFWGLAGAQIFRYFTGYPAGNRALGHSRSVRDELCNRQTVAHKIVAQKTSAHKIAAGTSCNTGVGKTVAGKTEASALMSEVSTD